MIFYSTLNICSNACLVSLCSIKQSIKYLDGAMNLRLFAKDLIISDVSENLRSMMQSIVRVVYFIIGSFLFYCFLHV